MSKKEKMRIFHRSMRVCVCVSMGIRVAMQKEREKKKMMLSNFSLRSLRIIRTVCSQSTNSKVWHYFLAAQFLKSQVMSVDVWQTICSLLFCREKSQRDNSVSISHNLFTIFLSTQNHILFTELCVETIIRSKLCQQHQFILNYHTINFISDNAWCIRYTVKPLQTAREDVEATK